MLSYQSQKQLSLFETPFEQHLDKSNRWVQLAHKLPWDDLVNIYNKKLNPELGAGAINGRMVIGAIIIKHRLNLSDREVIETIQENMYMQYFVGLSSFTTKDIFHPTEFVHIRKRLQDTDFNAMTEELMRESGILDDKENIEDEIKEDGSFEEPMDNITSNNEGNDEVEKNKGTIQMDATVSDQKIKYPNDVDLLNTGRQETDRLIDILCEEYNIKRPRTYRKKARISYLNFAKKKNKSRKEIRRSQKHQLQYLKRNLLRLDELIAHVQRQGKKLRLDPFTHRDLRILCATRLMYEQQLQMHQSNTHRIDDRIVSIYQPYVRPIVRGKSKNKVEFGNKNGISLQNGYAILEKLSWDAYNECNDLKPAVENYKRIHSVYPEMILADSIYHTKANKEFCTQNNIKLLGKRPSKTTLAKMTLKERKCYWKFHNSRNHIEGKFGQGKNGYELNEIKAKYANTSISWIAAVYFVMNILVFAGSSFLSFFQQLVALLLVTEMKIKEFTIISRQPCLQYLYVESFRKN